MQQIAIPFEQLRGGIVGLPFTRGGCHPFVQTAEEIVESNNNLALRESALFEFLRTVIPRSAADVLLAEKDMQMGKKLNQFRPLESALPWREPLGRRKVAQRKNIAYEEARELGENLSIADGWNAWGPASERKVSLEIARLRYLVHAAKLGGGQRSWDKDPARAQLIFEGPHWAVVLLSGHHRAAAYAALGKSTFTVTIERIITTDNVEAWPSVCGHQVTEGEAKAVFTRILNGTAPAMVTSCKQPTETPV